ncbi:MAG: hypothetical protein AAGG01_20555 [Planctomycetota bacterium]
MSSFRLARLLALRENQERAEQIRWAQAQRAVVEASELRDAGRQRIRTAYESISQSHSRAEGASSDARGGHAFKATLAAYETLDTLHERGHEDDRSVDEARRSAHEARIPYDERRQEVEALRRLEARFRRSERRKKRRRENREREAFINGRYGAVAADAPQAIPSNQLSDTSKRDSEELNR